MNSLTRPECKLTQREEKAKRRHGKEANVRRTARFIEQLSKLRHRWWHLGLPLPIPLSLKIKRYRKWNDTVRINFICLLIMTQGQWEQNLQNHQSSENWQKHALAPVKSKSTRQEMPPPLTKSNAGPIYPSFSWSRSKLTLAIAVTRLWRNDYPLSSYYASGMACAGGPVNRMTLNGI